MSSASSESSFSYEPGKFISAYESLRQESFDGTSIISSKTVSSHDKSSNTNKIVVAAVQMETSPCSNNNGSAPAKEFLNRALDAVEKAVVDCGANLVLLQELFMGPYFCQSQEASMFALAELDIEGNNALISIMREVAKKYEVVLPISVFEQKNNTFYNSIVMIDADGEILGTYSE
jgi:predicted amidohydrolase